MNKSIENTIWSLFNEERGIKTIAEVQIPFLYAFYKYTCRVLNYPLGIDVEKLEYQRYQRLVFDYERYSDSFSVLNIVDVESYKSVVEFFLEKSYDYHFKSSNLDPKGVNDLIAAIIGETNSFGDLTSGYGGTIQSVLDKNPHSKLYGIDFNLEVAFLSELKFAFDDNVTIESLNSLEVGLFNKVESIGMVPPFKFKVNQYEYESYKYPYGLPPKSSFDLGWLQLALANLKEYGRAVILLPENSLHSKNKQEKKIRTKLVEANMVDAVVSLPNNIFRSTGIKTSLWVLNKNKTSHDVLMIDTESYSTKQKRTVSFSESSISAIGDIYHNRKEIKDVTWKVSFEDIKRQDFDLSVKRYVDVLKDVELKSPVQLSSLIYSSKRIRLKVERTLKKVDNLRLSNNGKMDISSLEKKPCNNKDFLYKGKLILLPISGSNFKFTYLDTLDEEVAISQLYSVFEISSSSLNIDFLLNELSKEYVKDQINRVSRGSAIKFLSASDVLSIIVDVPTLESQQLEVLNKDKQLQFEKLALEKGFNELLENFKKQQILDLGAKKHNINQHLNNVKTSAEVLKTVMFKKKEGISIDDIINPKRGTTIGTRIDLMLESIEKVVYYVDNLTNELKFDSLKRVDLKQVIDKLISISSLSKQYQIEFEIQEELHGVKVDLSEKDFEELYNNILENAKVHGFVDVNKLYTFKILVSENSENLLIRFENDGKPFPKGMSQKYSVKGEKAGVNANTGIGSWKVVQIATHLETILEIIDEPESTFPVGVQLKFKKDSYEI